MFSDVNSPIKANPIIIQGSVWEKKSPWNGSLLSVLSWERSLHVLRKSKIMAKTPKLLLSESSRLSSNNDNNNNNNNVFILQGTHSWYIQPIFPEALKIYNQYMYILLRNDPMISISYLHFTPRKYWLITQEAMAPSRYDWKIVDWDVKPQHNQPISILLVSFQGHTCNVSVLSSP